MTTMPHSNPRTSGSVTMWGLVLFMALALVILAIDHWTAPSPVANGPAVIAMVPVVGQSNLSDHEVAHMQYMREEEKLAHDVYLHFANIWGRPIFGKIAQAEQRHTDAVRTLLTAYGVADPSLHKGDGEFVDPTLSGLYRDLIKKGELSLTDALMVGGLIEEVDIADLEKATASTRRPDIIRVYTTIHRGSRNHLRSFARNLAQSGVGYAPQKLPAAEVQGILTSPMETGPPP